MTTEPLALREKDARGAVTLTLNRPQAFNALYEAMLGALQTALDRRLVVRRFAAFPAGAKDCSPQTRRR